ncbi:MAG: Gfo/Idh/MocA family oxidoreductase [Spirochaetales bacterium]|nr:Gfo/Idh/MocA family oxidoreductase [Spirochaetales bacterium]MCF7938422.1 Gfo/Idh/MocA family oxidoreductase [Spirochaetales bacterium]
MRQVRYGIIGLGWFGEFHVDTMKQLPQADLTAVCTRTESRLKEIAENYSIPTTYTDYHDLLANPDIEAVSVLTHVADHADIAIDALRAGKHVFIEKPMANTPEDCDRIIEEAQRSDKFLMIGHICRFDSAYALAAEQIAAGKIGKVVSLYAKRNLAGFITETQLEKISSLFGDGIHDLDLMFWFTGSKPVSVSAQTQNTRNKPYDDIGWAMFRLENGATAVVQSDWSLPNNVPYAIDAKMEVIGTEGIIQIDNSGVNFMVLGESGVQYPQATYWPKVNGMRRGYLKEELDYFLKCVSSDTEPEIITPQESRDVVYAMRVAEEAARKNEVIHF